MVGTSLKETHPQNYYFKTTCRIMYYLGMGDCWYETEESSRTKKRLYSFWQGVSNGFIFIVLFDEILAYFRSDLTEKSKNDLIQFSIAHPLVSSKILALYWRRDRVKVVMKRLLEGTRSICHSLEVERSSMKQSFRSCLLLIGCVYMTLISALFDAVQVHFKENVPISTEVVLYPRPSTKGMFAHVLRFFIEYHWYHLMAMMLTIDSLVLLSLVTVRYKFQMVQLYFQRLRTDILENPEKKERRQLEEDFRRNFVTGIKMHQDALWQVVFSNFWLCARNVQDSMGVIYSIQVFESVALLVICLVKLVMAERNLVYLLHYMAYIACLVVLTGFYMLAAGDITYEASMVPTSIFHCGWELIRARSDFRVLAVVALQRSQVPVYMTAFGVIVLSYTNFISVLRSSYSFFAVMY